MNTKTMVLACLWAALSASVPAWGQSGTHLDLYWGGLGVVRGGDPVKIAYEYSESGFSQREHHAAYSFAVSGSANLETGLLKGSAMASAWDQARFQTTFFDEFVINGEPGSVARIGVSFAVDGFGDLDDVGDNNREYGFDARVTSSLPDGSAGATSSYRHLWGLYTFNIGGSEIFESTPVGDVLVNQSEKSFFDVVLYNWLDVPIGATGMSAPLAVQWILAGHANASEFYGGGFAAVDVSNTGRAGLILPQGYSFASASGAFLAAPIPEPLPWMLFACGLLLMLLRPHSRAAARIA